MDFDPLWVVNGLLVVIGYFVKQGFESLKKLSDTMTAFQLEVAKNYATKKEVKEMLNG